MADNNCGTSEYVNDVRKYEKLPEDVRNFLEADINGKTPSNAVRVRGYDFNQGVNYPEIFKTSLTTGLQATNFGRAVIEINKMRNGADYAVYINTAQEFDGSDSGARPDEAVSWGKISAKSTPVKIYGEASLIFPQLVAETFVKRVTLPLSE